MTDYIRWSTPKQIKMEKDKERRSHRGIKKGERRKGLKARLDELQASKRQLEIYAEWITRRQMGRYYASVWGNWPSEAFDDQRKKHMKLLKAAMKDGVIAEAWDWWVWKP